MTEWGRLAAEWHAHHVSLSFAHNHTPNTHTHTHILHYVPKYVSLDNGDAFGCETLPHSQTHRNIEERARFGTQNSDMLMYES